MMKKQYLIHKLILLLTVSIFTVETALMFLFKTYFPLLNTTTVIFIDSFSLIIIISPVFYFILYRLKKNEQETEKNTRLLEESNYTKDKLFSIIAHDLRGPISALEGLLKLLNTGDIKESEFRRFIPKLKNDVNS